MLGLLGESKKSSRKNDLLLLNADLKTCADTSLLRERRWPNVSDSEAKSKMNFKE